MLKPLALVLTLCLLLAACAPASEPSATRADIPTSNPNSAPDPTTEPTVPPVPTEPVATSANGTFSVPTAAGGSATLPPFDDPGTGTNVLRISDAATGATIVVDAPAGWATDPASAVNLRKNDNTVSVTLAPANIASRPLNEVADVVANTTNYSTDAAQANGRSVLIATVPMANETETVFYFVQLASNRVVIFTDQPGGPNAGFFREEILQMAGNVRIES